ncbi:MAG: hypothetical protein IIC24_02825 [Chloroflexi bacterium]|nr:hypothetical protein [Chloroflexota bacterium]
MSADKATREEVHSLVDQLSDRLLPEAANFIKVIMREPDDLTEDEMQELELAEDEFQRGEFVRWPENKRTDT